MIQYVLKEKGAEPSGYVVTYTDNKEYAFSGEEITNTKDTTEIQAEKIWKSGNEEIDWPEDVEKIIVTLYAKIGEADPKPINDSEYKNKNWFDGIECEKTIEEDTDGWKAIWENLPSQVFMPAVVEDPENGVEAKPEEWADVFYSIRETAVAYASQAKSPNTIRTGLVEAVNGQIVNNETVKVKVVKVWQDGENADKTRYSFLTYNLYRQNADGTETLIDSVRSDASKDYAYAWDLLPAYDENGNRITYNVEEAFQDGENDYECIGVQPTFDMDKGEYTFTCTNVLHTEIEVDKKWEGADESKIESITYTLTRNIDGHEDQEEYPVEKQIYPEGADSEEEGETGDAEESAMKTWECKWTGLPAYGTVQYQDADGQTRTAEGKYEYQVEETQFMYEGKIYSLTKDEKGRYTVSTIETSEPSYDWFVTREGNTFTNAINDTQITVKKVWKENGTVVPQPSDNTVDSISVELYRDKEKVGSYTLTTNQNATGENTIMSKAANTWEWTLEGLEKYYYDENGQPKEHEYYVIETAPGSPWTVESYQAAGKKPSSAASDARVTGGGEITITNSIYTVSLPSTGSIGTHPIYAAGLVLSFMSLIGLSLQRRKEKRYPRK